MGLDEIQQEEVLWDNRFKEDVISGRFFWITNKHVMDFKRGNFKEFWELYEKLPKETKRLADEAFTLLKEDPKKPSLKLIKVGRYWSMPIGETNRALGVEVGEDGLLWCWIGSFSDYKTYVESVNIN